MEGLDGADDRGQRDHWIGGENRLSEQNIVKCFWRPGDEITTADIT